MQIKIKNLFFCKTDQGKTLEKKVGEAAKNVGFS